MYGVTPSYPPATPALSLFPPDPVPAQHLTTFDPASNGGVHPSLDLSRPQQSLSAVPSLAQEDDTDVDMSESEASAKAENEDADFAAYSSASASPPVVAPGHAAKKRGHKVGLPDYADPDLYGLRRSVSRARGKVVRPAADWLLFVA